MGRDLRGQSSAVIGAVVEGEQWAARTACREGLVAGEGDLSTCARFAPLLVYRV